MDLNQLLTIVQPLIVFGATWVITYFKDKLPGWLVVGVIVPLLSAGVSFVATLIIPGGQFWPQFFLNLLATFVNELVKQLKQIPAPTP